MRITRIAPALIGAVIAAAATGAVMTVTRPAPTRPVPAARPAPAPAPTVTRTITRTRIIRQAVTIPASVTAPAVSLPPVPHINGATHSMLVYCAREQCTSLPGAGPYGGTCGPVVDDRQECAW